MRFHAQNLNDKPGGLQGSMLRAGRCWWGNHGFEWSFGWKQLGAEIGLATHDHALSASLALFFVALYWHWDHHPTHQRLRDKIARADERYGSGREIGFKFYQEYIWIDLWNDPMESSSKDPWWWHISIDWKSKLLGRTKYTTRTLRTSRVEIPMPEANYPATAVFSENTWKRSRLPWNSIRRVGCEITPDVPIPFPGKGENSWDCGEDATHSMSCSASTEAEAVAAMVKSILHDRYRHGGLKWRPEKAHA